MADKTVAVRFVARIGQYRSSLREAAGETRGFAQDLDRSSKSVVSSVSRINTVAAVAGKGLVLGLGGALAVSAKAAIDFESSFTGVLKTVTASDQELERIGMRMRFLGEELPETAEGFDILARQIRNLAVEDIPLNVNELNRIAELGGQLGVSVGGLENFIDTIGRLGVTTNLETEQAATGLARLNNILGLSEDTFDNTGSVLVELGNNFATTESEILTFALRIAPVAQTVGLSADAVLALSAAFSSIGVPAERGGTALQRFFIDIQSAVDTGGDSLQRFADVAGMTSSQFVEAFQEAPGQALVSLLSGLDRLEMQGENVFVVLDSLGVTQQRSVQAILGATNAWELFDEALATAAIEVQENNALLEESERRFSTTESQIQFLVNDIRDFGIEIGTGLLPKVRDTVGFFREFIEVLDENRRTVATMVLVLGGLGLANALFLVGRNITTGIAQIAEFRKGLQGMSKAARNATIAQTTLGVATNIAIGAFGVFALILARNAKKAFEFEEAVRSLKNALDEPQGELEGLKNFLQEAFSEDLRQRMLEANIGLDDMAQILLDATGRAGGLEEALGGTDTELGRLVRSLAGLDDVDLAQLAAESPGRFQQLRAREQEIEQEILALEEQLRAARASRQLERREALLTGELILGADRKFLEAGNRVVSRAEDTREALGDLRVSYENLIPPITDFILGNEDAADEFATFVGKVTGLAMGMEDDLSEAFRDIEEQVRGSVNVFDEYSGAADINFAKVREGLEKQLQDIGRFTELTSQLIAAGVSPQVVDFLDVQDLPTQAAIADLAERSPAEFEAFVGSLENFFVTSTQQARLRFEARMPFIAEEIFAAFQGEIVNEAGELDLINAESALLSAIEIAFSQLPQDIQDLFEGDKMKFAEDIRFDALIAAMDAGGFRIGAALWEGAIRGLESRAGDVNAAIERMSNRVDTNMRRVWEVSSPSRRTERIGAQVREGFLVGVSGDRQPGFDSRFTRDMPVIDVSPIIVTDRGRRDRRGGDSFTFISSGTMVSPSEVREQAVKGVRRARRIENERA